MTMDPNKRMTDLITLSTRLIQVLARENAALRTKRTHEVAALVNEKATLTRAYESRARGFLEDPANLVGVEDEPRQTLKALMAKVRDLMEANGRLLQVAMKANRRVLELAAEAVRAAQEGPGVYGSSGAVGRTKGVRGPVNMPVSVDRSL